jgi:tetratricopeptide (TPR) repeat protein
MPPAPKPAQQGPPELAGTSWNGEAALSNENMSLNMPIMISIAGNNQVTGTITLQMEGESQRLPLQGTYDPQTGVFNLKYDRAVEDTTSSGRRNHPRPPMDKPRSSLKLKGSRAQTSKGPGISPGDELFFGKRRRKMKDIKNRRKRFYQPWIIRVLVLILAVSSLPGAGRYAPPGNGPMVSGQTVEDLIEKGKTLFALRQIAEAFAAFTKAIELDPRNGVAFRERGRAKLFTGDYEGALADYGRAILLDPMDYDAYKGRAQVQRALKHYAESLEDCDTAISINPQDADVFDLRSRIKQKTGDYKGALQDISKAIELVPSSDFYLNQRASVKSDMADYKGALADCNRSLEIKPNDNFTLYFRAAMLLKTGDPKAALIDITKALEIKDYDFMRDLLKQIQAAIK